MYKKLYIEGSNIILQLQNISPKLTYIFDQPEKACPKKITPTH
jgi:hypothetical protein